MDYKKIGDFLKSLRKAKGLTQQDVADALYVTQKTVSRWETGEGIPDINILTTVASFYGISVDELLNGERQKPNQSSYTVEFKEGEKLKLIKNNIIKKSNNFGLASIGVMSFLFLIGLLFGLLLNKIIGLILGILGIAVGLIIFFYGFNLSKQQAYESDLDLSSEEKNKLKRSIHRANIVFIDVMAALIMASLILFTSYLLPVFDDDISIFSLIFAVFFVIGFIAVYLLFRHDAVSKCDYSYKNIKRSLTIALGVMEIVAMMSFFKIILNYNDGLLYGKNEETHFLSLLVFANIGTPYISRLVSFFFSLVIIIAISILMIKGKFKIQTILAATGLLAQFISFVDLCLGILDNYQLVAIIPDLFGSINLLATIGLFIAMIKQEKKEKLKESNKKSLNKNENA